MGVILKPDDIGKQLAELERRLRIMENTSRVTDAVVKQGWPVNRYKARATMTAPQTINASASGSPNWQLVTFNSVSGTGLYDPSGSFSPTNNTFTVLYAGRYDVKARVGALRATGVTYFVIFGLAIFVNGAEYSRGSTETKPLSFDVGGITEILSGPLTAVHSDQIPLLVGDVVDVRAANYGQAVDALTTDSTLNYFVIGFSPG